MPLKSKLVGRFTICAVAVAVCWLGWNYVVIGLQADKSIQVGATRSTAELDKAKEVAKSIPQGMHIQSPRARSASPSESFKSSAEALLAKAAGGDVTAAKTIFRETTECNQATFTLKVAAIRANVCAKEDQPESLDRCRRDLQKFSEIIPEANKQAAICSGTSDEDEVRLRFEAVTTAAKMDDTDAQLCAVQGDFDQRLYALSDSQKEQYQIDAITYLKNALERGDWRVVQALTVASRTFGHTHNLSYLVTEGDAQTVYRMLRLLRMGAVGDYAAGLDKQLADYMSVEGAPAKYAEADAWAQQEYEKYFSKSERLTETPTVCGARAPKP